jgi:heme exporter protein CcmD
MSDWFEMHGYAKYIWPSFGIALIVLVYNVLSARALLRRVRAELRRRLASEALPP